MFILVHVVHSFVEMESCCHYFTDRPRLLNFSFHFCKYVDFCGTTFDSTCTKGLIYYITNANLFFTDNPWVGHVHKIPYIIFIEDQGWLFTFSSRNFQLILSLEIHIRIYMGHL